MSCVRVFISNRVTVEGIMGGGGGGLMKIAVRSEGAWLLGRLASVSQGTLTSVWHKFSISSLLNVESKDRW